MFFMAKRRVVRNNRNDNRNGGHMLDARVVSLTLGSVLGIVYLFWVLVIAVLYSGMMRGYGMMGRGGLGVSVLVGLIQVVIVGLVVGVLYAALYNYFTRKVR